MSTLDWFDVSNYDHCASWTARDWYYALVWRNFIRAAIESSTEYTDQFLGSYIEGLENPREKRYTSEERTDLWRTTIIDLHRNNLEGCSHKWHQRPKPEQFYRCVRMCDLGYLGAVANELIRSRPENEQTLLFGEATGKNWNWDLYKELAGIDVDEAYLAKGLEHDAWDNNILITVDIGAPDSILIEQFMQLVRQKRTRHNIEALPRAPDEAKMAKWHRTRILGYFDISLFKITQSAQITDQQIGIALFPSDYDVSLDDRIRKVVRPLANKVFNEANLLALFSTQETQHESFGATDEGDQQ